MARAGGGDASTRAAPVTAGSATSGAVMGSGPVLLAVVLEEFVRLGDAVVERLLGLLLAEHCLVERGVEQVRHVADARSGRRERGVGQFRGQRVDLCQLLELGVVADAVAG